MPYKNISPLICGAAAALALSACSSEEPAKDSSAMSPAMGTPGGTGAPSTGGSAGMTMAPKAGASGMPMTMTAGASGSAGGGGSSVAMGGSGPAGMGGTTPAGMGGMMPAGSGGSADGGDAGTPTMAEGGCTPMPSGTFETMSENGGPDGNYVIFRPRTLGEGGFLHPPVAWGNGLSTVPSQYDALLNNVASHGFVVIANPGTGSDPMVVRQGLEWLLDQNGSGMYAGKLAVDCAGTIGYSMGGGAAVGAGSHPAVKAVVSIHGLQDASDKISGPLLLTTSNDDGFVTPEGFVQPCYDRSSVQPTIMATFMTNNTPSIAGHLTPLGDGQQDAEPMIAWLRYWLYGDQAQRKWFFGDDCTLCVMPWGMIQRKNYDWN